MKSFPTSICWETGAICRNIRVGTADPVVETLGCVDINTELRVIWVGQISLFKVFLNGGFLVMRLGEVIREPAGATEVSRCAPEIGVHYTLGIFDCLIRIYHGSPD